MTRVDHVYKAVDFVAAYVVSNHVEKHELGDLIYKVTECIAALAEGTEPALVPAVPIDQSVFNDHIVCLEDGQKVTLLKRYLKKHFDLTPEEYREKWGLPDDYPMVTKKYSQMRSKIAKAQGLGLTSNSA